MERQSSKEWLLERGRMYTVITITFLVIVFLSYDMLLHIISGKMMRELHFIVKLCTVIIGFSMTFQFWFSTRFQQKRREIYLGSNYFLISILLVSVMLVTDYTIAQEMDRLRIEYITFIDCLIILLLPIGMYVAHVDKEQTLSKKKRVYAFLFSPVVALIIIGCTQFICHTFDTYMTLNFLLTLKVVTCIVGFIIHLFALQKIKERYEPAAVYTYKVSIFYFVLYYICFFLYRDILSVYYLMAYMCFLCGIFMIFKGMYFLSVRSPYRALEEKNEEIEKIAFYDRNTELPNREHFRHNIQQILEQNDSEKVLFLIEMERLEIIRSALGFNISTRILAILIERLEVKFDENHYLAIVSDDKLALCLSYNEPAQIDQMQHQIFEVMEHPFEVEHYKLRLNVVVGAALYKTHHEDGQSLRRFANQALMEARAQNTSFEMYRPHWNSLNVKQFEMEKDLIDALRNNEIQLHYQPKLNVQTGTITAVEALVRWYHPERGYIPPLHFIPLLEQSGLIADVGEFVLRKACSDAVFWETMFGWPLQVSVNLSLAQLLIQDYVKVVHKVLAETNFSPQYLNIEVTESVALSAEHVIPVLKELRELGIKIAVDDFGTGYSSLAYLYEFPVDVLKIDRSFVNQIGQNVKGEIVLAAIVEMAKNLGLEIVAEGVEEREQLLCLKKLRCDFIQGYYISRPVPMATLVTEFTQMQSTFKEVDEKDE